MKMFYSIFLGFFIMAGISQSLLSQGLYYWSNNQKFLLAEDRSSMVVFFKHSDKAAQQSLVEHLNHASLREIRHSAPGHVAILEFNDFQAQSASEMLTTLGLSSGKIRSYHYAVMTSNGTRMWPTHEITLKLKNAYALKNLEALLNPYQATLSRKACDSYIISVPNIQDVFPLANHLQESHRVQWAHPNFIVDIIFFNDPLYPEQYSLHNTGQVIDGTPGKADIDIDAPEAWAISKGTPTTVVAVIDQGVEDHEDLNDPTGKSRVLNGYPAASNGRPDSPDDKHGMPCAGIIAASHNHLGVRGIAPAVQILPVNIWAQGLSTTQDIADAINWAWQNGADVLSNSWGYGCNVSHQNIIDAITNARTRGRNGKGCVVVASSGNSGTNCISFPADAPGVLAVGAIDKKGEKSSYSQYGPRLDLVAPSNQGMKFDVRSTDRPGSAGYSSGNYTKNFGGTSASCPMVAGVAALVVSRRPALPEAAITQLLKETATDVGNPGKDELFGYGIVNAHQALTKLPILTSLTPQAGPLVKHFTLQQNYPNPFNPATTISFSVSTPANVQINIYDSRGKRVRTLFNQIVNPGAHTAQWNGQNDAGKTVSSGIYIYQMTAGKRVQSRKMLLLK